MSAPSFQQIEQACKALSKIDQVFKTAYKEIGRPEWRTAEPSYASIARIIAFQQISTSAASAIWNRVLDDLGDISVKKILDVTEDRLRSHGLSRPKIRHLKSIALAMDTGVLCLKRVGDADPDSARNELLNVKGIGPWTAEIYQLNALGRLDAFPASDIGLMESYRMLSNEAERRNLASFTLLAEDWRPYRGVAAHLLWGWINTKRSEKRNAAGGKT